MSVEKVKIWKPRARCTDAKQVIGVYEIRRVSRDSWRVEHGGRYIGPFSLAALEAFIDEAGAATQNDPAWLPAHFVEHGTEISDDG